MNIQQQIISNHDEIMEVITKIRPFLKIESVAADYQQISELLGMLSGKITLHHGRILKNLYTASFATCSLKKKERLKEFIEKLAKIRDVLNRYMDEYLIPEKIQKYPGEFMIQSNGIFVLIREVLRKEKDELIPILTSC